MICPLRLIANANLTLKERVFLNHEINADCLQDKCAWWYHHEREHGIDEGCAILLIAVSQKGD